MQTAPLGTIGIEVSRLSFGAGPVPALMTTADADAQRAVVRRALDAGINWFDTAAGYGDGRSELGLGEALAVLGAAGRVHVATKVRVNLDSGDDLRHTVRASLRGSLERLRLPRVTLLQLHNPVTRRRGDLPTSITPRDVLEPGGVLDGLLAMQCEGLAAHLGLTGVGHAESLREVIASERFAAIQLPYNVLNPSAGREMPAGFGEADLGTIIADCAARGMGVFPIRVFAGGALARRPPSEYTRTARFFPLDLYERDRARAEMLRERLGELMPLEEFALRFVLSHPEVTSAIVGFTTPEEVDAAATWAQAGSLPRDLLNKLAPP